MVSPSNGVEEAPCEYDGAGLRLVTQRTFAYGRRCRQAGSARRRHI